MFISPCLSMVVYQGYWCFLMTLNCIHSNLVLSKFDQCIVIICFYSRWKSLEERVYCFKFSWGAFMPHYPKWSTEMNLFQMVCLFIIHHVSICSIDRGLQYYRTMWRLAYKNTKTSLDLNCTAEGNVPTDWYSVCVDRPLARYIRIVYVLC